MKRTDFLAGLAIFLVLFVLAASSVNADVTKARPAEPENFQENVIEKTSVLPAQFPPGAQTDPNKTLAATETPTDKNVPSSLDPKPDQVSNNAAAVGVPSSAVDRQAVASVPDSDNKAKNKAPLSDVSYESNKTALKAIGKSVDLFKDTIKERFTVYLERSAQYIEIMKEILRGKDLPEELVFLPIVESGFNPNAYSRARAVGPWQFIASTAKRYGLVIDWWRDERKDPVKSTVAAAEYLRDLYKMFGSWNLALAAYNAGEGKISKALRKSDSVDYWSLLNTKQIRNETKEYVPRYIAATMIANTPEEYGFDNLDYHEPLEYDEVTVNSPLDIDVIAKCAECTVKEIREANPELRRWSTPANVAEYTIRIPAGSKDIFLNNLTAIPKEKRFTVEQYTLKKGDTIKKIARKTGIPGSTIAAMNSLNGLEHLTAGNMITLPPKGKFSPDLDDRVFVHKVAYKKKMKGSHQHKKGRKGKGPPKKATKPKGKSRVKTKKA
jgi:membrane-bound lytic murein transglycosylase D